VGVVAVVVAAQDVGTQRVADVAVPLAVVDWLAARWALWREVAGVCRVFGSHGVGLQSVFTG